jgi:lysophospholipase L1-like esterase
MKKVLVFGDSIAWGAFDSECGGWVERLKIDYLKNFKEKGVGIYNLAISSNDTRGVLHGIDKEIDIFNAIEPEEYIFLFSIGSNDAMYIDTKDNLLIPIDEFKNNLSKIIKFSQKHASKIIFTGLMAVDETLTKPWKENIYWENDDLKKYNDAIEGICKKEGFGFIPLWDVITKDDVPDGLHPNANGHEKIYTRVKESLKELV